METLDLTPAEVEQIKLNREKQELEKKEKLNQLCLKNEKALANHDKKIKDFLSENQKFNDYITKQYMYLNSQHPEEYQIIISEQKHFVETSEYYNADELALMGVEKDSDFRTYQSVKVKSDEIDYTSLSIALFSNNEIKIKSVLHNGEIKVYATGIDDSYKYLKNVETLHKKIKEYISKTARKKSAEETEAEGMKLLISTLTSEFPQATIEKESEYIHSPSFNRKGPQGYTSNFVKVTFPNGLVIQYTKRYYQDQKTNQMVFVKEVRKIITNKLDQTQLIETLIKL